MSWRPEENERLILDGQWSAYRGQKEFKFQSAMPDIPIDPRDQLKYVCERTRGIGYAIEQAIWDAKGAEWRSVTDRDVKALGRGDLLARFQETIDLVEREAEKTQVIGWLMGHGATIKMATAAWDIWKKQTIGVVSTNPYRLTELPHYGFVHVDNGIRQSFGIGNDDPRRIRAGVIYALQQLTEHGSTAIDWSALRDVSVKHLNGIHLELIVTAIGEMFQDGTLRGFKGTQRIALGLDYQNELEIFDYVAKSAA